MGWMSWYTFFDNVTKGDVLRNAQILNEMGIGINTIQVDDGWERAWGDWYPNDKFTDIEELVQKIEDMGFISGIWLAPFLSENAPEDWILKDSNGDPIVYTVPSLAEGTRETFALDVAKPQVKNWISETIKRVVAWGFKYLKVDFLFAGAIENPASSLTSLQIYREAMKLILDSAGEGVYILACGAPILPTASLSHGMRIGPDIALYLFPYEWRYIKAEYINLASRFHLGLLFAADPDAALLRDISVKEAEFVLTMAMLPGGIFYLSDDVASLPSEKIELLRKLPELMEDMKVRRVFEPMIPKGLFDEPVKNPPRSVVEFYLRIHDFKAPSVWKLADKTVELTF
jgi:alpha-galactosidase